MLKKTAKRHWTSLVLVAPLMAPLPATGDSSVEWRAVIAGADTGYDWGHPALKSQYRDWDGATASHDYSDTSAWSLEQQRDSE